MLAVTASATTTLLVTASVLSLKPPAREPKAGPIMCVVGEPGSGNSVTAQSVMRPLPRELAPKSSQAAGSTASAQPMRNIVEPLCSSVDADFPHGPRIVSPDCSAPVADGRRGTLEISVTAARGPAQVGDFEIADAYLYNGKYIPEVWSVDPGDNILIRFKNSLSGTHGLRTNLHTHGLIVSPNNASGMPKSPLGDNIYVLIESGNAPAHDQKMHAPANSIPIRYFDKVAEYLIKVPADHPKGLFWYHPHPHGNSGLQVLGGMSGFLTVGKALDYVAPELQNGVIEEKLLALKDTQVTRQAGASDWRINERYNSANCENPARKQPGVCFKDDNNAWLFPVNGQIYPTIEIAEGTSQLWRIGNIGANATYQLELVEVDGPGGQRPLPFQIIAIDGVPLARDPGREPIPQEKILMMPSARLEVLVRHPGAAGRPRKAVFRTTGFSTGATRNDGDDWPAVDLAEVVFTDSLAHSAQGSGLALVQGGSGVLDFKTTTAASSSADCPRLADGQVRIVAFDVPPLSTAERSRAGFASPPGCTVDQTFQITGNVVTTVADEGTLEAVLSAYDAAVGDKYSRPFGDAPPYHGKCFDNVLDICVPYPSVEEWWVINASNEGHNFHIHQTRFRVLEVRGAGSGVTRPTNVLVDNYPVLVGQAIKVRIALNRSEQIGTFVFHCHILEHEDKGMMGAIEVRKVD